MKDDDKAVHNRLKMVLNHLGCDKNTSKVAKLIGVNSQAISNIYNRDSMPKLNFLSKLANAFPDDINYNWLLSGKGEMTKNVTNNYQGNFIKQSYLEETQINYDSGNVKDLYEKIIALQDENRSLERKVNVLLEEKISYLQS